MLGSPVDVSIIAGLVLMVFGPKGRPPLEWKFETNEGFGDRTSDLFRKKIADSFFKKSALAAEAMQSRIDD